jgi:hypothetical protein
MSTITNERAIRASLDVIKEVAGTECRRLARFTSRNAGDDGLCRGEGVSQMSSAIKWHGGEAYQAKTIVGVFPPHLQYVEPKMTRRIEIPDSRVARDLGRHE